MFTYFHENKQKYPIKIWLRKLEQIDDGCLAQALNLANLPFIHQWVVLMPDTHEGFGMPIGGVIATDGVIIPNAVGVDIGCGMGYVQTDLPVEVLKKTDTPNGKLISALIGDILRNVPQGFNHHRKPQACETLDRAQEEMEKYRLAGELLREIKAGYCQIGTLGGGNHFIEIQEDEEGYAGIMLHSGSRNFGLKICSFFNKLAKEMNEKAKTGIPKGYDLAYLPVESEEGQAYIHWMNLALDFARENREQMLNRVMESMDKLVRKHRGRPVEFSNRINCHHNYAALEEHYGKKVWVHRKGAIRAGKDEPGIIPGAMGSSSYIVKGLGNPESFLSSSHGAGRKMSRSGAKQRYSTQEVLDDLKKCQVVLGKQKKGDVAEECRFAYKDIEDVIQNELDLVRPVKKLKTIGVVKG